MHKLNSRENISSVVRDGLCMGCGVCNDVCHKKAIVMTVKNGLNVPIVDNLKCNNCGMCLKTCAGRGINLNAIAQSKYNDSEIKTDRLIGRYLQCYSGYSLDNEVRYHGASGGMVSQFLIYLLDKKIITGAVVTGFDKSNPLRPKSYIAYNKDDILRGKSSKYCVVSFDGIISEIKNAEGKFIVVGLPCHIQAFRKYETIFPKFKNKIKGYFSIYCSATKSYNSIDYMMGRYSINPKDVKSFTYRDEGCMGYMIIKDNDDNVLKRIKCLDYYIPLHGFFNTRRCSLCIDHYGELADVSFGDIKTGIDTEETIGESSLLVRNAEFRKLLEAANEEGYIHLEEISSETLNSTQGYAYKHKKGKGVEAAFLYRKLTGRKLPVYDTEVRMHFNLKFLIREFSNSICRFIGNNKYLWFIIKQLDKKKI